MAIEPGAALIRDRINIARDAVRTLQADYPEAFEAIRASSTLRTVGHRIRSRLLMDADAVLSDGRDRDT